MFYDPSVTVSQEDLAALAVQYPGIGLPEIAQVVVRHGPARSAIQAALDELLHRRPAKDLTRSSPTVETVVW